MKKGDHVEIFEYPLTRERKEGNAVLVEFLEKGESGAERWKVNFPGEAGTVGRTILPPEFNSHKLVNLNPGDKVDSYDIFTNLTFVSEENGHVTIKDKNGGLKTVYTSLFLKHAKFTPSAPTGKKMVKMDSNSVSEMADSLRDLITVCENTLGSAKVSKEFQKRIESHIKEAKSKISAYENNLK